MKRHKCIIIFILVCSILVACQPEGQTYYADYFKRSVEFYTVDGIQKFVSYVSNNRYYEQGDSPSDYSINSVDGAERLSQNITLSRIVQPKQGVPCTSFRFSGEGGWDALDLVYYINGVRYAFTYDFALDSVKVPPEQSELKNVSIDSINFDLYQAKDGTFHGSFLVIATSVGVIVSTDNPENINFDYFELVKITKNLK